MKITDVRIYPYDGKKKGGVKLVAFANVTFDDCLAVRGFRLFTGEYGYFIGCPSEEVKDEYKDVAFPTKKSFRVDLTDAIVEAFEDYDEDEKPAKKSKKKRTRDVDDDELPD